MSHPRRWPAALAHRMLRALTLSALPLVAWACHDATGPAANPGDGTAAGRGQSSPYYCTVRTYTTSGVREGSFPLTIPPAAQAADGSSMEYRYRRKTPSGAQTYAADCVIPRTMSALDLMNQRFRVPEEHRAPRGRDRGGNEYTTQGCVIEGECTLEPIEVIAPKDEECERAWDGTCQGTSPDEPYMPPPPSGGGGDGGGGDGDAPPEAALAGDEITSEPPDCSKPQTENWAAAYCRAVAPSGTRLTWTNAALDRIAQRGQECASIAARARELLSQNALRYFAPQTGDKGGWASSDIGVLLADYWVDQYGDPASTVTKNFDHTLVHEVEHTLNRGHIDAAGYYTPNSKQCGGLI